MASVRQTLGGSFNTTLAPSQHQQRRYQQYQYQQEQEQYQQDQQHHPHQYQQYRQQKKEEQQGSVHHIHRLPRVDVVEMEIPVVMANFPQESQPCSANDIKQLPIVERGTDPGVPFDLCSLSTVGSQSVASTHRRFKKYTTTTITTTTVTKIVLPHMSQVLPSDVNNPMHSQNILMAIEDKKSGSDNINLRNSNTIESSQTRNNSDGYVYPRNYEQQQEERPEWDINNAPVSDAIPLKASRHPRQNSSNPNSSNKSRQTSDTSNGRNGSFTSGELIPHAESSLPQVQQQQPWVFNHQTVSKTTSVSRHQPPISASQKNDRRDLSVNGTAIPVRDEQVRRNRQEVYGEPNNTNTPSHSSQYLRSMPNSAANEKISENVQQPWILNEEKTQREWYTVE